MEIIILSLITFYSRLKRADKTLALCPFVLSQILEEFRVKWILCHELIKATN